MERLPLGLVSSLSPTMSSRQKTTWAEHCRRTQENHKHCMGGWAARPLKYPSPNLNIYHNFPRTLFTALPSTVANFPPRANPNWSSECFKTAFERARESSKPLRQRKSDKSSPPLPLFLPKIQQNESERIKKAK